jgi:hypothetical protein
VTAHRSANLFAPGEPRLEYAGYAAGRCNIGPAEIARRRRFGHAALLVTAAAFVALLALGAPAWTRLLLFFPAAGAAAGYLQAALRFCADYGWRGVFNFGRAGHRRTTAVAEAEARRTDRRMALFIAATSAAVGVLVALLALLA